MKSNYGLDEKESLIKKIIRELIIWVVEIAVVILLAYCIIAFGVVKISVIGTAMSSTLEDGDKILVNKMAYRLKGPKRNDVVVFMQSGKEHSFYHVKRVIGLPGETVQIIDGKVYINGEVLDETIQCEPIANGGLANEEIVLEANEYFVLGDNRNQSEDSRFASIGNILRGDILGKAWIRLSPFDFVSKINLKKTEE
ncbi:signal peptidase I [Anaeromicropila populeti]|uniref:Signal peptidase I n=1 Tax=Anaeromicropila populeti TaxID=37658 RepID=A0A1I6L772_9FIRM|nr:signal peptidase I [Anaeromicropila populeti]SFR99274.1 signal peptidase I [Anaeromicropila populeti]